MTERKIKLPAQKADDDYEVGYTKPPTNTQFQPGQSGNPKGRPKGAKNKRSKLNEERLPEPIPHPDQVKIDMNTAEARIQGPATKEEKAQLDLWLERKNMFEDEQDGLLEDIEAEDDAEVRGRMGEDLKQVNRVLGVIDKLIERIGY